MDIEILKTVGQIAGIGGLSLGIFFLLFKELIRKNIFPKLETDHAYKLIRLFSILIWSAAIVGLICWFLLEYKEKDERKNALNQILNTTHGVNSPIVIGTQNGVSMQFNTDETGQAASSSH